VRRPRRRRRAGARPDRHRQELIARDPCAVAAPGRPVPRDRGWEGRGCDLEAIEQLLGIERLGLPGELAARLEESTIEIGGDQVLAKVEPRTGAHGARRELGSAAGLVGRSGSESYG
jgi:hypothetical protein